MSTIIEAETGAIAAVSKTPPDEARNKKKADTFIALANSLTVTNAQEFEFAAEELRRVKDFWSQLESERISFTGPLNAVLDKLNARFQPYLKALCGDGKKGTVSAESIIKAKMAAFQEAEHQRVEAERRKAQEAADAERRRLEAAAAEQRRKAEAEAAEARRAEEARQAAARKEQERIEAEAAAARGKKAKAEAEARAAHLRAEEQDRQERAAREAQARKERSDAEAAALEQTAAVITAAPVAQVAGVSGIIATKAVDYEITSKENFLRFALEKRPDLLDLWEPDAAKMRALVKLQGLATNIPGLRVFPKTGITVR